MQDFGRRATYLPSSVFGQPGGRHAPAPSSPRGRAATATARGCTRPQARPFRPTLAGRGCAGKMAAPEKMVIPEKLR